jgi:NAD(P)-dependent dehydrogenase (short-subunit alcohol dehydrogenase family)
MNILITGAASGIGRATVDYFLDSGHRVFGIDVAPAQERENFRSFVANITDEASLNAVRAYLQDNGIVLDAILNIAGIHMMASLVEGDYARMKKVVDINLTGTMLVNRVFHQCLKKDGRIVIITSEVASMDPMPFNGLYNVTKTALDCYAQALRQELNLIGQKVITVHRSMEG